VRENHQNCSGCDMSGNSGQLIVKMFMAQKSAFMAQKTGLSNFDGAAPSNFLPLLRRGGAWRASPLPREAWRGGGAPHPSGRKRGQVEWCVLDIGGNHP
jgi:hypothetical protein